jgi:hypothetical protein
MARFGYLAVANCDEAPIVRVATIRSKSGNMGHHPMETQSEWEYSGSVNRTLTHIALLLLLAPIAVSQTSYRASDCSTLKYARHKVSCLCGTVQICSGDICLSPSGYELDDDITVELRDRSGKTIDKQKAAVKVSEEQGIKLDGTTTTYKQAERRFSFEGKGDGSYLLAFILYKNGVPQPALIFPTNYSHKRNNLGNRVYMLEPSCPR